MNNMEILGYFSDKLPSRLAIYRLVKIDGKFLYQFKSFDGSWQNSLYYYYGESKPDTLIPIPANEAPK